MEAERKRYSYISVLRVLAMLSIVLGHWCSYANIYLYDLGGIGVEVFLLISGFLCGKATHEERGKWYAKKATRIMPPVVLWTVLLIVINLIGGSFEWKLPVALLGIQGMRTWMGFFPIVTNEEMVHTWFITIIMICYLLEVLIPAEKKERIVTRRNLFLLLLLQVAAVFVKIQLIYFLLFFIGEYIAICGKESRFRDVLLLFGSTVLLGGARLVLQHYIDGTTLYVKVLAPWFATSLGMFIFVFFRWAEKPLQGLFDKVANSKVWRWLDAVSYDVYIAHFCFLHGVCNGLIKPFNSAVQFGLFLVLSFVGGFVLHTATAPVVGLLQKGQKNGL